VHCVVIVKMKLSIAEGYVYQRPNELAEVTDKSISESLMSLASISSCEVITKDKAISMGFEEIANWSAPEDKLVFIDNSILLCCKESDIKA